MNRNQKIALGCGGAGCLGLIVIAVVGIFGYLTYVRSSTYTNGNRSINFNLNTNRSTNSNTNSNTATDDDSSSSSSMSEDDKHKLFQAASMSVDGELTLKVLTKIGYPAGSKEYAEFVKAHIAWTMKNADFIRTVDTPEKARAYVEAHLQD